jgi:CheY-like chemotaxis protein
VHRFDRALAPSGVRAAQSAEGILVFSVLEAQWPAIRETFSVMGEGRRFSTGRFNRVRITPEASLLQPQEWNRADIAGLRGMRQEVFLAQSLVRRARQIVARAYADTGAHLDAQAAARAPAAEASWCAGFTETFVATAQRADYIAVEKKIRVLIVDDSLVIRRLLTKILSSDGEIEVVGAAEDPIVARDMVKALHPDVLTLDVEMPRMNGLEFLRSLMKLHPMPVVMCSTLTQEGAGVTLDALGLGAIDFIAKPSVDAVNRMQDVARDIIEKVK